MRIAYKQFATKYNNKLTPMKDVESRQSITMKRRATTNARHMSNAASVNSRKQFKQRYHGLSTRLVFVFAFFFVVAFLH